MCENQHPMGSSSPLAEEGKMEKYLLHPIYYISITLGYTCNSRLLKLI